MIDPKPYYEHTSGILRAFCQPDHHASVTFDYTSEFAKHGIKFFQGEVVRMDEANRRVLCKTMDQGAEPVVLTAIPFDYCVIAAGCNYVATTSPRAQIVTPHTPSVNLMTSPRLDGAIDGPTTT